VRIAVGLYTDMFERHQMVDEKDALALEQFPDCLAPLTLHLRDLLRTASNLFLPRFFVLASQHFAPVGVLAISTTTT